MIRRVRYLKPQWNIWMLSDVNIQNFEYSVTDIMILKNNGKESLE